MAGKEKPIKLPDDFEQTLRDLLATGPTPKEDRAEAVDEAQPPARPTRKPH